MSEHITLAEFYRFMAGLTQWVEQHHNDNRARMARLDRRIDHMTSAIFQGLSQAIGDVKGAVADLMSAQTAKDQKITELLAEVAAGRTTPDEASTVISGATEQLESIAQGIHNALDVASSAVQPPGPVGAVPSAPVASPAPIAPAAPAGGTVTAPDGSSPVADNDTAAAGQPSMPSTDDQGTQATPGGVDGVGATTNTGVNGTFGDGSTVADQGVSTPTPVSDVNGSNDGTGTPTGITPEQPGSTAGFSTSPATDTTGSTTDSTATPTQPDSSAGTTGP